MELSQEQDTQIQELERRPLEVNSDDEDDHIDETYSNGKIYQMIKNEKGWEQLTRLPEAVVLDIGRCLIPSVQRRRKRGAPPRLSWLDHVLLLIVVYVLGMNSFPMLNEIANFLLGLPVDEIAMRLDLPGTTASDAIKRIRPILLEVLKKRWWANRNRPVPLEHEDYPFIGLIADSTSIEVFRPRGRFEEAKIYYDGKNRIYALKKEIAVMAAPPHYALFSASGEIGSTHDFTIHKEIYSGYVDYLKKTRQEKALLPSDNDNDSWAILLDKAYVGGATETPGERRITPFKKPSTSREHRINKELGKVRVPVECFFGRMYKLFGILRHPYPFDHDSFDMDLDIMILLTNENIRAFSPLALEDREFYKKWLVARTEYADEREKKAKQARIEYRERQKEKKRFWAL